MDARINYFQNTMSELKNKVGMNHTKMVGSIKRSLSTSLKMSKVDDHVTAAEPFQVLYDMTNEELELLDDHMDKQFNKDEGLEQVLAFIRKHPTYVKECITKCREITIPMPVKERTYTVDMPKVKNLRFEFSDGNYALKWDEENGNDVDSLM
jgi:hypothetical protein